jgi:hypothetical protein|tara:strand:- start:7553 stop:9532 length:1980 start_codon:yes stop_codon:yes gene_type:complete
MNAKDLKAAKQELEKIKSLQDDITKNSARYNKEGILGVKAHRDLVKLKEKELSLADAIEKTEKSSKEARQQQVKDIKERNNLAKRANKLAKDSKSLLLEGLGINARSTSLIDAANTARKNGNIEQSRGYSALEKLRQDSIDQLQDGTFITEEFDDKVKDLKEQFGEFLDDADFDDMVGGFDAARKDSQKITDALGANLPFFDQIDSLKNKLKDFSDIFLNPITLAGVALGFAVKKIGDFVVKAKELRQELGTTAIDSAVLSSQMSSASLGMGALLGDGQKARDAVKALAENMGRVPQLSASTAREFGNIAALSGASAENLGSLLELQTLVAGGASDQAVAQLKAVEAIAESEGLLKSKVFDDVASAAKDSALFFGKSAVEIARATKEMRKLGIETNALNRIADSILDLESSISSEFELQTLFGKTINLNKAREAAFNRDSAGLAKEIKMQLGGQFDLNKANFAQVKSLTDAFGLTQEELQKIIQGQDVFNNKAKEGNQVFDFIKGNATALGIIVGGLVGLLSAIGPGILAGFGFVKTAAKNAAKSLAIVGGSSIAGAAVGGKLGSMASSRMENFEVSRKGVNDGQGIGVNASLGDNMFIAADKRTQETLDLHTNTLVNSLVTINESLQRLEKKTTQKLDNINTTTADTANRVQKAISEG